MKRFAVGAIAVLILLAYFAYAAYVFAPGELVEPTQQVELLSA